jgi:uncharacterized protein YjiS (DUF1127 family)
MTTLRTHNFEDEIVFSSALYGFVHRIEAAAIKVQETLATWASRSEDRRQLALMSDRMLLDIGLNRIDVAAETNKYFWQN